MCKLGKKNISVSEFISEIAKKVLFSILFLRAMFTNGIPPKIAKKPYPEGRVIGNRGIIFLILCKIHSVLAMITVKNVKKLG